MQVKPVGLKPRGKGEAGLGVGIVGCKAKSAPVP